MDNFGIQSEHNKRKMQIARHFKGNDVENLNDFLQKGKAAQEGEERTWNGKKFKKQGGKWIPVTGDKKSNKQDGAKKEGKKQEQNNPKGSPDASNSVDKHEIAQLTHIKSILDSNPDKAYEIYQALSPEAQDKVPQDVVNKLVQNSHSEKEDAASKVFEDKKPKPKKKSTPKITDLKKQNKEHDNVIERKGGQMFFDTLDPDTEEKKFKEGDTIKHRGEDYIIGKEKYDGIHELQSLDDAAKEAYKGDLTDDQKGKISIKRIPEKHRKILAQVDEMDRDKYNKHEQKMMDEGVSVHDIRNYHMYGMYIDSSTNIKKALEILGTPDEELIEKGRKAAMIGTVKNGRMKVDEGKWIPIKKSKSAKDVKEVNKEKLNKDLSKLMKMCNFTSANFSKRFSGKDKNIVTVTLFKTDNSSKVESEASKLGFSTNITKVNQSFGRGQMGAEERSAIVIWKDINRPKK